MYCYQIAIVKYMVFDQQLGLYIKGVGDQGASAHELEKK